MMCLRLAAAGLLLLLLYWDCFSQVINPLSAKLVLLALQAYMLTKLDKICCGTSAQIDGTCSP
jgi:hypothetical protein